MARVVKPEEYTQKRNEILDVTRRLIYTKGFEQMSVQDILNELQISKGAFYHYFNSKMDLLEALLDRIVDESESVIDPILNDPQLNALEKIQTYFNRVNQWKMAQKEFLLALMEVWYADDNALVRQKLTAYQVQRMTGDFNRLVEQGVREGCMKVDSCLPVGEVVLVLLLGMAESIAAIMLKAMSSAEADVREESAQNMKETIEVYTLSIKRVLGITDPEFQLMSIDNIRSWID
jgi:AcrR family transcriptional regulator